MHFRGWLGYTFALMLIFIAVFMVLTRFCGQGPVDDVKVIAPPVLNTMEQLLAVQNAISQTEGYIQDGNIVLLKIRALLLCIFPQVFLPSFCLDWHLHLPLFSLLLLWSITSTKSGACHFSLQKFLFFIFKVMLGTQFLSIFDMACCDWSRITFTWVHHWHHFIIYQSQLRAISVDVEKIEENVNGLLVFVIKSFTSTCQYMGIYDFIRQATNSQLLSWSQLWFWPSYLVSS